MSPQLELLPIERSRNATLKGLDSMIYQQKRSLDWESRMPAWAFKIRLFNHFSGRLSSTQRAPMRTLN